MEQIKHEYKVTENPEQPLEIQITYNTELDEKDLVEIEEENQVIQWQKCKQFLQFVDKLSLYCQNEKSIQLEDVEYINNKFVLKGRKADESISLEEEEIKIKSALEQINSRYIEKDEINYENSKFLGKGGFGQVHSIKYQDQVYALKIVYLSIQKISNQIYVETQIIDYIKEVFYNMLVTNNKYIVGLKGYSIINESDRTIIQLGMIMEYMKESLNQQIYKRKKHKNYFSKVELTKIIEDVKLGLICLKALRLSHRDLSPQNILFSEEGNYKVSDMGAGTFSLHQSSIFTLQTGVGKEAYMAPEIQQLFLGESKKGNWYQADIYSFAKVILDCGVLSIINNIPKALNQSIEEFRERYGSELADQLIACLDENPQARLKLTNVFEEGKNQDQPEDTQEK